MSPLRRLYDDHSPHHERWSGKVDLAPGRALWFRYTLLDGVVGESSTWAAWFDQGRRVFCGREVTSLALTSTPRSAVFSLDSGHLDDAHCAGHVGPLSWSLRWYDSGQHVDHMPDALTRSRLPLGGWTSPRLDARVSGTVTLRGQRVHIHGAPATLGHLHGRRFGVKRRAWLHCNCFDDAADASIELAAINPDIPGGNLKPITSGVLLLDGQRHLFQSLPRLLQSRSRFDRDRWRFSLFSGDATLKGEVTAPPDAARLLIEETDTDGEKLWCEESPLASLRVELKTQRATRLLTSTHRATFGAASKKRPPTPPHLA